jgi:hypothetical protein
VKETGSPLASNRATLFIETACCAWEGWVRRNRIFVSTRTAI